MAKTETTGITETFKKGDRIYIRTKSNNKFEFDFDHIDSFNYIYGSNVFFVNRNGFLKESINHAILLFSLDYIVEIKKCK